MNCSYPECECEVKPNGLWIAGEGTGHPAFCSWECLYLYAESFAMKEAESRD